MKNDGMAADILKLIEEVDPSDAAKLDEIDARVDAWMNGLDFVRIHPACRSYDVKSQFGLDIICYRVEPMYFTRSLDAIVGIAPEGWQFTNTIYSRPGAADTRELHEFLALKSDTDPVQWVRSPRLLTEPLARLHAAIQSLEYERSQ